MNALILLAMIGAGALAAFLFVVGGIWFLLPLFLIGAAIVARALDNASRWRIAAFSVGALVLLGFQLREFAREVVEQQHRAEVRLKQDKDQPKR